jgi:hypothetical protein
MRFKVYTFLPLLPSPHSHAHIPSRSTPIDARIVDLAQMMGRPAEDVEGEIHSVISLQFAKGRILPLHAAIKCHGEAQAFFDAFKLERDWPAKDA